MRCVSNIQVLPKYGQVVVEGVNVKVRTAGLALYPASRVVLKS